MNLVISWDNWQFSIGPDTEFAAYVVWLGPFMFLCGTPDNGWRG